MSNTILSLLVCPLTKQHLMPLDSDKTATLQLAVTRGELYYIDGSLIPGGSAEITFLITQNRHHVYSVIDGIPVLLESKQIALDVAGEE